MNDYIEQRKSENAAKIAKDRDCKQFLITVLIIAFLPFLVFAQNSTKNSEDGLKNEMKEISSIIPDGSQDLKAQANEQAGNQKGGLDDSKSFILDQQISEENKTDKTTKNKSEDVVSEIKDSVNEIFSPSLSVQSLMFSKKQISEIGKAISAYKQGKEFFPDGYVAKEKSDDPKNQELDLSYLHLVGILYSNPKKWTIWINERKITPEKNDPKREIFVKKVNEKSAAFVWRMSFSKWKIVTGLTESVNLADNLVKREFTLQPNQSYNLATDKISEGEILAPVIAKSDKDTKSIDPSAPAGAINSQSISQNQSSPQDSGGDPSNIGQDLKSQIQDKVRDMISTPTQGQNQ